MIVKYFVSTVFEIQLEHSVCNFYRNEIVESEELSPDSYFEFEKKLLTNFQNSYFKSMYVKDKRIINISKV